MKKFVLPLLALLSVLIVTCVYQKTYTIYSASSNELTLVERKATSQSKSTVETVVVETKEEKTSTLPVAPVNTPTKPVEVKPESENKSVSEHKSTAKTDKAVEIESETTTKSMKELIPFYQQMIKKEAKEKATPSTKNSTPVKKVPTVTTEEVATPKAEPVTQNASEKEIVDYVMWALNNRDIALKNRDEVEARIHDLINKALNDRKVALADRKIVLDERSKNEVELEKLQAEQIDARDASYESVINPKTTNQGEK